MTKTRGFEILSTWQGKDIHLPERKTEKSAGYDIECGEDIDLIPHQVTLIKTGLKASREMRLKQAIYENTQAPIL